MTALARLVRDPLLHFLIAGGLLFALFRVLHGPSRTDDESTIRVDQPALLRFMQYQSMAFQPKYFGARFAALSQAEQDELIDRYVREEALVREATRMGLADGDYVIRRRMVQKMLYLLDDTATESFAPSPAALEKYFLANQDRYRIAPTLTFTHVFVDSEIKRREGAEAVAERLKRELESRKAGFDEAPRYGDRFPYLQNCVQRSPDFIESQFGAAFTSALTHLEPSTHWQGPIKSNYGYHLVLLTKRQAAHLPELADIEDQVRDDLLRDTIAAYRERAIKDLTRRFTVKLEGVPLATAGTRTSESTHPVSRVAQQPPDRGVRE